MFLSGTQEIGTNGTLWIGGCDTTKLAAEFGTPLYVVDEKAVRQNCRRYKEAYGAAGFPTQIAYAGKAFLPMAMVQLIHEEGLWLDVASGGELYVALKAGFPAEKIIFHGNNKSQQELEEGLDAGVARFCVDNLLEMEMLNDLAMQRDVRARMWLRLAPGIDPHTHKLISTGQADTKFGIPVTDGMCALHEGMAMAALEKANKMPGLEVVGIHAHVGSQLFDTSVLRQSADILLRFAQLAQTRLAISLAEINIGGGLGVRYTWMDRPPTIEQTAREICVHFADEAATLGIAPPKMFLEPGRSIVGEAGITLYTVGAIKEIPNTRVYAAIDGGISDNPRPQLYDAKYEAICANKAGQKPRTIYAICGKHCETDILIQEVSLPSLDSGDILAVLSTGAYNHSMSSNYNRIPRPACIFVKDGQARLVVRRENYEDLIRTELVSEPVLA
jgi:diaminopimelate decarboxylase